MIPMSLSEVQKVLYDILVDIHEFCTENDIKYSLAGGTLLGAIRHDGFIPWDDDIDIQLSRPEYDKFIRSYKSKKGYQLFSRETSSENNVEIAFSRVCEMDLTFVNVGTNPWQSTPTGLWVDVVPIDGAPSDEQKARSKIMKMYVLWKLSFLVRARQDVDFSMVESNKKKFHYLIKRLLSNLLPKDYTQKYIEYCQEYSFAESDYIANYSTMQNKYREWQPKESMKNYVLHRFEDGEFYIMEGYETSLRSLYGEYMKFPPKEKQVAHVDNLYYWK